MPGMIIGTPRLLMRRWQEGDLAPFAALCADPEVMRHFRSPLTPEESDALVRRIEAHFDAHGFGLWALERRADRRFLGFTGLLTVDFASPIAGEVEIGWRLARAFWGQGYAGEAARAALDFGFAQLGLARIVSMTVEANARSWRLMERLGMARAAELDFDHPRLPEDHALRPHIVYAIDVARWLKPDPSRASA